MQSGSTSQESRRENKGKGLSPLDKSILIQYSDMREEIKDLRRRIRKLESEIDSLGIVSDSVKGTRKDGTIGSIKITGYPEPRYWRLKNILESRKKSLIEAEEKLQETEEFLLPDGRGPLHIPGSENPADVHRQGGVRLLGLGGRHDN